MAGTSGPAVDDSSSDHGQVDLGLRDALQRRAKDGAVEHDQERRSNAGRRPGIGGLTFRAGFGQLTNTNVLGDVERLREETRMATPAPADDQRPRSFHASPAEANPRPLPSDFSTSPAHEGTGVDEPDFIAVVDADPGSDTYGQLVHETPMPNAGDELHHFGWNRCSSACHGPDARPDRARLRSCAFTSLNVADRPQAGRGSRR